MNKCEIVNQRSKMKIEASTRAGAIATTLQTGCNNHRCDPLLETSSQSQQLAMEDDNDQTYVKIISADGPEFFIERRIALQVDTMKAMLEGNFKESEEGGAYFEV